VLNDLPHTGINELDPNEEFSVSAFLEMADRACVEAVGEGDHPVILGGTALYLRTFLYGLDNMPDKNPDFRRKMREFVADNSSQALHDRLKTVDPTAAENIHPNDTKRVIRALEIHHETGQTKTELKSENTIREAINPEVVGLSRPREELDARISKRVDKMLNDGLIEEIKELKKRWTLSTTLKQAIGFQSVTDYLDGKIDLDKVRETMVDRTRNLMRKQESWFKRFPVQNWYHPENDLEELMTTVGNQFN
jgi:tRNA dimethylallyltransferase